MDSAITTVDKVMKPVSELVKVSSAMSVSEVKKSSKGFSRVVVFDEKE